MTGTYLGGNLVDKIGAKMTVISMLSLFLVSLFVMPFSTGHQSYFTLTSLLGAVPMGNISSNSRWFSRKY